MKVEIVEPSDAKIKFSPGYAFLWVFAYFFHRNQVRQDLPLWKCAGMDILVWGFLLGFVNRITGFITGSADSTIIDIIQCICMCILWGFVGAWRFNRYHRPDFDITVWKRRDFMAACVGATLWFILIAITIMSSYSTSSTERNSNIAGVQSAINTPILYFESSYACDAFFDKQTGLPLETNSDVERAVKLIHTYCPNENQVVDTVTPQQVIATYPQLSEWNWDNHFIHTYLTTTERTAYIYIKKLN